MNLTDFGCNYSEALNDTGIRTFNQGLVSICYDTINIAFIIINFQTMIKMIKNHLVIRYEFLFITCCFIVAYSIGKFSYFLLDIVYCGSYPMRVFIDSIPFTLYLIIVNIFNYSICIGLLEDFHTRYIIIRKRVTILKNIQLYFLFPLLILECLSYILVHIKKTRNSLMIQFVFSFIIFLMQIILFIIFMYYFRLLIEKKEKINYIKSKYKFTPLFTLIISSLIFKLVWISSNNVFRFMNSSDETWFAIISKRCFYSGSILAQLIYIVDTFCSESLTIIVITIFLSNVFKIVDDPVELFDLNDSQNSLILRDNSSMSNSSFQSGTNSYSNNMNK